MQKSSHEEHLQNTLQFSKVLRIFHKFPPMPAALRIKNSLLVASFKHLKVLYLYLRIKLAEVTVAQSFGLKASDNSLFLQTWSNRSLEVRAPLHLTRPGPRKAGLPLTADLIWNNLKIGRFTGNSFTQEATSLREKCYFSHFPGT